MTGPAIMRRCCLLLLLVGCLRLSAASSIYEEEANDVNVVKAEAVQNCRTRLHSAASALRELSFDYSTAHPGITYSIIKTGLIWELLVGVHDLIVIGKLPAEGLEEPFLNRFTHITFVNWGNSDASAGRKLVATGKAQFLQSGGKVPELVAKAINGRIDGKVQHKPILVIVGWDDAPSAQKLTVAYDAVMQHVRAQDVVLSNLAGILLGKTLPQLQDAGSDFAKFHYTMCAHQPDFNLKEIIYRPALSELARYRLHIVATLHGNIMSVPVEQIAPFAPSVDSTPIHEWPSTLRPVDSVTDSADLKVARDAVRARYNACMADTTQPAANTDIIVFTRNRPLETFAFLESVADTVGPSVHTVWVQYCADTDRVRESYEIVGKCFGASAIGKKNTRGFPFFVRMIDDAKSFEKAFRGILAKMTSHFVSLCVDEQVWLTPLSLHRAACLLHSDDQLGSMQLRLHTRVNEFNTNPLPHSRRLLPELERASDNLNDTTTMFHSYLPYRLGIPWAYLSNVDAAMLSKARLLDHFKDLTPNNPMAVEQLWLFDNTHKWDTLWHVFPSRALNVNNNDAIGGGRIMTSTGLTKGAEQNVNRFLDQRQIIDIPSFRRDPIGGNPRFCHETVKVKFVDRERVCPL